MSKSEEKFLRANADLQRMQSRIKPKAQPRIDNIYSIGELMPPLIRDIESRCGNV